MFPCIIVAVVVISAVVQLFFNFYFFSRVLFGARQDAVMTNPGASIRLYPENKVSVIVCAYNEGPSLEKNLEKVLQQQYHDAEGNPMYEVIVVNDRSDDHTAAVLNDFASFYSHLKVISVGADEPRTFPGKKFALSKGVAAAANELLLMTDADCYPASKTWILWMTAPFARGKKIVAGYGAYEPAPGLLNRFIRCETIHTYLQYWSYSLAGVPYMAVGRNLACTKELMEQAQKSPVWQQTPSGDDDLLVNICGDKENMVISSHPASFTYSIAKSSWRDYAQQKQRHMSTGKYYRPTVKAFLGAYALSHALFWLGTLVVLCAADWLYTMPLHLAQLFTAAVLIRCALLWPTFAEAGKSTGARKLSFFWPLFDLGWLLYNGFFAPYIFFKNKYSWK